MELQRVDHDLATEEQETPYIYASVSNLYIELLASEDIQYLYPRGCRIPI